mmetsp:Transcript_728/g.907  ORF Transcript_728/g.907 Transcript_728/m.907 type:complete len:119 (+) Transcript_728:41-397(+)
MILRFNQTEVEEILKSQLKRNYGKAACSNYCLIIPEYNTISKLTKSTTRTTPLMYYLFTYKTVCSNFVIKNSEYDHLEKYINLLKNKTREIKNNLPKSKHLTENLIEELIKKIFKQLE